MTIKDISKNIPKYIISDFKLLLKYIRNNNEIMNFILNNDLSISEIAYLLKNNFDIKDITCRLGNKKIFLSKYSGYRKFCGIPSKCICNKTHKSDILKNKSVKEKKLIQKKRYKTNLKKYGSEFPPRKKESVELAKRTMMNKYGVDCVFKLKDTLRKSKETNLKKYGVDNPAKSKIIQNKIKKTCIEKYGVDHPWKNKKIRENIKNTFYEKYGVDHPSKSELIKNKRKQTCIKKYGVDHPLKSKIIQDKVKELCFKKHGVTHFRKKTHR